MPDISLLADKAAYLRRSSNLTMSGAVWRVLRAEGLANVSDAKEIASDVYRELQRRSTSRRKKNIRDKKTSRKIPEQHELKLDPDDARAVIEERGGDPED